MLLDADSDNFQKLERLTVILYDKWSPSFSINETRKLLFCHENRSMEKLPPTQDALLQHVRRAVYTKQVSGQALPSPRDYGWMKEPGTSTWVPAWMTIPKVSRACRELIKCCCKGACTTCKCTKANLPCSPLCK